MNNWKNETGSGRPLTFSEIVLCTAVVALFSSVLYPIIAQARSASRHDVFVANMKTLTASTLQYAEDADGVLPLAFAQKPDGSWYWNYFVTIPSGWNPLSPWNGNEWPNSVQPYFLDWKLLEFPGLPLVDAFGAGVYEQAKFPWANSSVGYNGLLHGYALSMVENPSFLPIIWTNTGESKVKGAVFVSPSLACGVPGPCHYIPAHSGCLDTHNGETSRMFPQRAAPWVYDRSAFFASVDGHVRKVRQAAVMSPGDTDRRLDPETQYGTDGMAGFFQWDGCHVWLFRPDYDFSD